MPLYRFTAFDSSGSEREGSIDAANAQDAAKQVAAQGLRVRMIQELKSAPPTPPISAAKPAAPRPQTAAPSQQRPAPVQKPASRPMPPTQVVNVRATQQPEIHYTRPGSDKDRMFLFSQIGAGLRAGINPAELFAQIAPRTSALYKPSLQAMGAAATEGIPLSRVMAQYPDLYPEHVVGAMRAGEAGGFMPEACDMISQQAENAHKFKRSFWYAWVIFVNAFLSIPLMFVVRAGFLKSYDYVESMGEGATGKQASQAFFHYMWKYFVWPVGPELLVASLVCYLIWLYMGARVSRRLRHKLGLGWPVFGKRAKFENLTVFSWTMSKLTAAGLPYQTSWELASSSMPNMEMQARMAEVGRRVTTTERISDVFQDARIFPQEYAPTMATAEYTGSVPAAMEQLSRTTRNEFEAQETYAKLRGGCWGCLALTVSSFAVLCIFLYMYYYEFAAKVSKIDDTTP